MFPQSDQRVIEIGLHERLRTTIETYRGVVTHFAVQLEHEAHPGKWLPVARYDTTGGVLHRDRLHPDGEYIEHRKAVEFAFSSGDAITYARRDLMENVEVYVEQFRQLL